MGDTEVHHQRHLSHHVREVANKLDVPTLLTPVPNHLLCFRFLCCVEKVSNLSNHPVVRPRVSSWNFLEPQVERLLSNNRDLGHPLDTKLVISVRRTESSTVGTIRAWEHRLSCSSWRESVNLSLRSRKYFQRLSIWRVILCCDGMAVTTVLEACFYVRRSTVMLGLFIMKQ